MKNFKMILNWRDYLSTHKDKEEYERNADQIQSIVDGKAQASANFLDLCDHPTLVVLTRSPTDKDVQISFYHSTRKSELLTKTQERFALVGFGRRACAMRVDPKEMFRQPTKKQKVPSFNTIMNCASIEDISGLTSSQTMVEEKLESHAILPPSLTDSLYDQESMHAKDILFIFIQCIKQLKFIMNLGKEGEEISLATSTELEVAPMDTGGMDWSEISDSEIGNARTEESVPKTRAGTRKAKERGSEEIGAPPVTQEKPYQLVTKDGTPKSTEVTKTTIDLNESDSFDSEDRFFERRYGNILRFLWSIVHEDSAVKPTRLNPCCRKSAMKWADTIHDSCLHSGTPLPPQFTPPPGQAPVRLEMGGFDNAAVAMAKLSDAWEKKIEMEVQEKENRDQKKKEKSFEKLADVQKRTFILMTAKEGDSDSTVPEMKPTQDVLKLLEQTVGIKAQAHLQHEFNKHGHICDVGLAMSTQIKNGCIMSQPSVNDINGISPFFLPDQASEERLGHELALRLEEQLVLGKISDTDLKTITKCKIHFAKNFGEYVHFIRNFHRLIIVLAGETSIFTSKLESLLTHAREHERAYKELEKEYFFFYASVLETIHRRCQQFIHSTTHGLVSKLKFKKLEFGELLEEIEDGEYIPTKPKWLRSDKKRESPSRDEATPRGGGRAGGGEKPHQHKRKSVDNPKFDQDLKVPSDLQYRQIFHPANRRGVAEVKHLDGSVRCNNWFFRGWCTDTCQFSSSHSKSLSASEKVKCKDYVTQLVEKHRRWSENQNRGRNEGQ